MAKEKEKKETKIKEKNKKEPKITKEKIKNKSKEKKVKETKKVEDEGYAKKVRKELKLVKWPTLKEVLKYTISTIILCLIICAFFLLLTYLMALVKDGLNG